MRSHLLFACLFLTTIAVAQNKSYYVNAAGTKRGDGSFSNPWNDVSKPNMFNFEPGDVLYFAGEQTFGSLDLQKNDAGLKIASYNGTATLGGLYAYNVGDLTIDEVNFTGVGTANHQAGLEFYMDNLASGDLNNIIIKNVTVSNFGGSGIIIGAWLTSNGYNNVQVLNSTLTGNFMDGFASYGYNDQVNNTNLKIINVKTYRNYGRSDVTTTCTGSGMVIGGFNGGLIENCEAYENGKNNRFSGGGPQGMWCYNSSNLIFQYNTSHDNRAGNKFDGGGFDIDGGSQNCVIQYCYSYNNDGPGLAFFEHGSTNQFNNNTIRYNISQNDGRRNSHGAIMTWAKDTLNRISNSQIYNNTVYVSPSATANAHYPVGMFFKNAYVRNFSVFNNIIYTTDTVKIFAGSSVNVTFSNNDYFTPGRTPSFTKGAKLLDPLFKSPGGGAAGYILKGTSPLVDIGRVTAATKDYLGNPVPFNGGYDLGAYESQLRPPVANAGADQTVVLPNAATLSGSGTDADGTIASYKWSKLSGPASFSFTAPSGAKTTVTNLVAGVYTFRLTVTDNDGISRFDDVQVSVSSATTVTKMLKVNIYGGTNPYANAEWNNWNVGTSAATNKTSNAFFYSNGSASTVKATISATSTVSDNGGTYGGGMAPAEVLRYTSTSAGPRTLTISGLSSANTYNLDLYASRNNTGYTTTFTVGSASVAIVTDKNKTAVASFTKLVPNASGQIVVSLKNGTTYNYLNGFSLTEVRTATVLNMPLTKAVTVEKTASNLQVLVFPNPAPQQFILKISSGSSEAVQLNVTDAAGRIVESHSRVAPNTLLQFGQLLTPGVYYAEVLQGTHRTVFKLVKSGMN